MSLEDIKNGIVDISELDVVTFTGEVSGAVTQDDKQKDVLDWEGLLKAANAGAKVSLVSATKLKIDGDTIQFISTDANPKHLEAHRDAVESAQNYRKGIVDLLADFLDLKDA